MLHRAIDSVLAQSDSPDAIQIVSDVPDPEAAVICALIKDDDRVAITYQERTGSPGASASRNAGVESSSADWIAFLDDDDYWHPDYLRQVRERIRSTDADVIVTWLAVVDAEGVADGPSIAPGLRPQAVVAMNRGATGSNLVVRRSRVEAIGGFDEALKMKNDTDFFYRLLESGAQYAVIRDRLVFQTKHDLGQLTGHSEARAQAQEAYMRKHWAALGPRGRREIRMWTHFIRAHTANSAIARAKHYIGAAINIPPSKYRRLHRFFWARKVATAPTAENRKAEQRG